jgi:hypothetical protein
LFAVSRARGRGGREREILDVNCELILMARDVTETAHSTSLFISLFLSLSMFLFRVVSFPALDLRQRHLLLN